MPKYKVTQGSSVLDIVLTPTRASTGHVQVDGRWITVTVIELSKEEIADWERVSEEYHAWAHRTEVALIPNKACRAGAEGEEGWLKTIEPRLAAGLYVLTLASPVEISLNVASGIGQARWCSQLTNKQYKAAHV